MKEPEPGNDPEVRFLLLVGDEIKSVYAYRSLHEFRKT